MRSARSIKVVPFTFTIHFVFSAVYSFSLFPIPAARMIACIAFLQSAPVAGTSKFSFILSQAGDDYNAETLGVG